MPRLPLAGGAVRRRRPGSASRYRGAAGAGEGRLHLGQNGSWQRPHPASIRPAKPPGPGADVSLCPEMLKDVMAAVETTEGAAHAVEEGGVRRRDFINIAAVSFAGVGAPVLLYPLVNQMNPSADVLALAQIDVDISA